MDKVKILGLEIDRVTMDETIQWIHQAIATGEPNQIITGNPEMVMTAQGDQRFFHIMQEAELVVPDGIGLILAGRYFIKEEFPERVTGFDLATRLFSEALKKNYSLYLLGGAPGVVDQARERLTANYPGLRIVGTHHGFLNDENREQVIQEITALRPQILLVGMGAPRQEFFIAEYKERLGVPISIGIGGSIDIWAGIKERAPEMWQKMHLEWFYRLTQEPQRLFRMMALPKFVFAAARYKRERIR